MDDPQYYFSQACGTMEGFYIRVILRNLSLASREDGIVGKRFIGSIFFSIAFMKIVAFGCSYIQDRRTNYDEILENKIK